MKATKTRKAIRMGIGLIHILMLTGCVFNISLFPTIEPLQEKILEGSGKEKIALIDLSGLISDEKEDGIMDLPDMVARVKEELSSAASDKAVKAIILRINSPGGTVTASDLIYHEVQLFKEQTGKTVIAAITDIGTSGAYYIAMAADQIVAHPTAVTGSIGVIMLHINLQGLMEKIGVGAESIKSGRHKDLGLPTQPLSAEGREILQGVIDTMYGRFLDVVAVGRKGLAPEKIRSLADGRIYSAREAKELGLVDEIGYLEQAIDSAKSKTGLKKATVIMYRRPHEFKSNIYSKTNKRVIDSLPSFGIVPDHFLERGYTKFLYLWIP